MTLFDFAVGIAMYLKSKMVVVAIAVGALRRKPLSMRGRVFDAYICVHASQNALHVRNVPQQSMG